MLNKLKQLTAAITATIFFVFATACGNGSHPNQLNAFDGSAYDSFTAAHAALTSIRTEVATEFPQYKTQFNEAAASYGAAYQSYVLYRQAPTSDSTQLAIQINNVATSIVALESLFESAMHVTPADLNAARAKAAKIRGHASAAAKSNISLANILTALEIAATVAEGIPVASPYAAIAALVIKAASDALVALGQSDGQPIDMTTIAPIAQI